MNSASHIVEAFPQLSLWTAIGYTGVACFAGRWLLQVSASRRHGRPVVPPNFWWLSVIGSVVLMLYFSVGHPDSVGLVSNLFALAVSLYNLRLSQAGSVTSVSGAGTGPADGGS